MGGKLYQVTHIDFSELTLEAWEAEPKVSDGPEEEIFLLEDFEEFKITLRNGGGKIVDFEEWVERHGNRKS